MDTKETLTSVLDKQNVKVWTGLNWLRTGPNDRVL
jgi:hypothetical protein